MTRLRELSAGATLVVIGGALALIVALVIAAMAVFGFGWFSNATANFRGNVAKNNLVQGNGNYRIAAYDHFFNLCQHVQSDEASITNAQDELKTSTNPQRQLVLNATITALRNDRADTITQYNADARKTYTLAQFRDSALPYQLDLTREQTSCVS